jgi:hypothetical protein
MVVRRVFSDLSRPDMQSQAIATKDARTYLREPRGCASLFIVPPVKERPLDIILKN